MYFLVGLLELACEKQALLSLKLLQRVQLPDSKLSPIVARQLLVLENHIENEILIILHSLLLNIVVVINICIVGTSSLTLHDVIIVLYLSVRGQTVGFSQR